MTSDVLTQKAVMENVSSYIQMHADSQLNQKNVTEPTADFTTSKELKLLTETQI